MPVATRSWKRQEVDSLLELSEKRSPVDTLIGVSGTDLELLASRTAEYISVVLNHRVCDHLFSTGNKHIG